tara:strand:- start:47 stop:736 length:690 start_codon:yes stop_codon:yes gene_type:complete
MSKSKKNTIDPENIIANYGADSARLFILSDSPPEKDVQWSDEGIRSSFKFIQKLWGLNSKITQEIKKNNSNDEDQELTKETNKFIKKVTNNLEDFSYNKIIANMHEIYSVFTKRLEKTYKKETLLENYQKILICMMPVIPHFTSECLKLLNIHKINWPNYNLLLLKDEIIKVVVQINGKKRGLLEVAPNLTEESIYEIINKDEKLTKYFQKTDIKRKVYIKNKLINIIT